MSRDAVRRHKIQERGFRQPWNMRTQKCSQNIKGQGKGNFIITSCHFNCIRKYEHGEVATCD